MDRSAALNAAKAAVADRPNQYGKPEQNFDRIAKLWQAHLENCTFDCDRDELGAEDVAIMMTLLKIARLEADPTHADSWIDLAGYAGCGAEVSGAGDDKPAQNSDLVDDVLHKCSAGWYHTCVNLPETKFGFTVGEPVNLRTCDPYDNWGVVVGFTEDSVRVKPAQGREQEWGLVNPTCLRRGA